MDLKQYIADINQQYQTGMARGRAYRPTLKDCKRITLSSVYVFCNVILFILSYANT